MHCRNPLLLRASPKYTRSQPAPNGQVRVLTDNLTSLMCLQWVSGQTSVALILTQMDAHPRSMHNRLCSVIDPQAIKNTPDVGVDCRWRQVQMPTDDLV